MPISRRNLLTGSFATGLACIGPLGAERALAADASPISFGELYKSIGPLGMVLSDKVRTLAGAPVEFMGFMAPPLKPDSKFFVLTRMPVSICPFCSSDADWPSDIVVVYLKGKGDFYRDGTLVAVVGRLEVGSKVDSVTGFISQLRLTNASVTPA
jgi:hypothetical protein